MYNRERVGCNSAIKRFYKFCKYGAFGKKMRNLIGKDYDYLYNEYVDKIAKVSWEGAFSDYDSIDISCDIKNPFLWRVKKRVEFEITKRYPSLLIQRNSKRFFSFISEDEFDEITKNFLRNLFVLLKIDINNLTAIDMLFSATNPTLGMEFFDDAKAIIINRDPRDIYVSSKLHKEDSRFMPNDDVYKFIEYYKMINELLNQNIDNIIKIQYEDLIYKYDYTTNKIKGFMNIKSKPVNEFEYFNPCYSVRYTNRKKLYNIYSKDIMVIENVLNDFLYDFDSAVSPINDPSIRERCGSVNYKGLNMV